MSESMPERRVGLLIGFAVAVSLFMAEPLRAQPFNPGTSDECQDFQIQLHPLIGPLAAIVPAKDISDEGWVWVDRSRKLVSVTGLVSNTGVATTDTPANHDSHDLDVDILLDPGQEDLLSEVGKDSDDADTLPDTIGLEWETGLDPDDDRRGDGDAFFPKWAWPSQGDRVWANGHWIFDCGHADENNPVLRYKSEIHPARAIASMRDQAAPLPGTGTTPVPVTTTDLYIHGRGGFAVEQLNCGMNIILGSHGDTCGQNPPPASDSYKTTPIAENFEFDVCLPPRPAGGAFSARVEDGPYNTIGITPLLHGTVAAGACVTDPRFDPQTMLRVTVPLAGSGVAPTDVYARRIEAGWVVPPTPPLAQRRVVLDLMDLHADHDPDPGDGNLTMLWLNVDQGRAPWLRLSDFASGMNDYDDDGGFGDGEKSFTGLDYSFYLRHGAGFNAHTTGYEQDCYDFGNNFGDHDLRVSMYLFCHTVDIVDPGGNDEIGRVHETFDPSFLGRRKAQALRRVVLPGSPGSPPVVAFRDDFDLYLDIEDVPLTNEDEADLEVSLACAPAGEVALIGQPFTCTTGVANGGPGLPRAVTLDNVFLAGGPSVAINQAAWTVAAPFGVGIQGCNGIGNDAVDCDLGTVPAAGSATMGLSATAAAAGVVTDRSTVATASGDPTASNDVATATIEIFIPITIDIEPRDPSNLVNLGRGGVVAVAILTTPTFDAVTADVAAICFGDAGAPGERLCQERHDRGHPQDVDKDGDLDLLLHYLVDQTGIDAGDTNACLIGRTLDGTGIYGCDGVTAIVRPL